MTWSVVGKTVREQRTALVAWALSLAALVGMYAAVWPSVRDQPSMSDFLDQMPDELRAMFAMSGADMSTPVGYVQVELLSFMGPMLLLIYAITAGASAVAGEEDRRTLDLLLGAPLGRARLVVEKLAAMVLGVTLLATVLGLAMLGIGRTTGLDLPAGGVAAAMAHLAVLAVVFGALALAVGAATGRPGLSRGIAALVAVVAYVVNGLGAVVSWLDPVAPLSPFHQYAAPDPLRDGASLPALAIGVGTVVVLAVLAVLAFRRRDVAA